MNNDGGGTAAERKASTGGDPLALMIPSGQATDSDGTQVPPFVKNPSTFVSKRNSSRMFYSMADAKKQCGSAVLATSASDLPTALEGYYPADLFAGFAPSLAELDPDGNPKIQLPRRSELSSWASKDWTAPRSPCSTASTPTSSPASRPPPPATTGPICRRSRPPSGTRTGTR